MKFRNGHRQILCARPIILEDTCARLNETRAVAEFFTRHITRQQNLHAIHPNVTPICCADQIGLLTDWAMDSDARIWPGFNMGIRQRMESLLDSDARMRRDLYDVRPHLAPLILPADFKRYALLSL